MKMPHPTETQDCMALVEWMEAKRLRFSHVPQETYTKSWSIKVKNKRMGVRKGVPDYLIILPQDDRHETSRLLFIEMKRKGTSPSDVSPEQRAWLADLNDVLGVTGVVCKGLDEAIAAIEKAIAL